MRKVLEAQALIASKYQLNGQFALFSFIFFQFSLNFLIFCLPFCS